MKRSKPFASFIEPLENRIAPAVVATINLDFLSPEAGYNVVIQGEPNYSPGIDTFVPIGDYNGDGFNDFAIGVPASAAVYLVFGNGNGFPTGIDVSLLNGTNGVKLSAGSRASYAGSSIAAAGDVNGDGLADVIVGAPDTTGVNGSFAGAAHVVFGRTGGPSNIELDALSGTNGFSIFGGGVNHYLGDSVSGAGDVNGDGLADVIVSAAGAAGGNGAAYIIYGITGGGAPVANVNLAALSQARGVVIESGSPNTDVHRIEVSAAGDVNGDGVDDVVIGVPFASPNGPNSGAAYVIFGIRNGLGVSVDVNALDGRNGFAIEGRKANGYLGYSLASGDINGDGFGDVIVAAPYSDENGHDSGSLYVVYGKNRGFNSAINAGKINGSVGLTVHGEDAGNTLGLSGVSAAGDFNGDGIDDLVVSAYRSYDHGGDKGITSGNFPNEGSELLATYVIFGKSGNGPTNVNLSKLDGSNGVKFSNGAIQPFANAGDLNGDGFDDLLIGGFGRSQVVFGTNTFLSTSGNGKSARFTDSDGDIITIKVSKGSLSNENFDLTQPSSPLTRGEGGGDSMFGSLMLGAEFQGAKVSVKAKKSGSGDGQVNLGSLNAGGVSLSSVAINGMLGGINVGDGDPAKNALKKLVIGSLATGGGGAANASFSGTVKSFKVLNDVNNATMMFNSGGAASVKKMLVRGSMLNSTMVGTGGMSIAVLGSIEGTQIQAGDFIKSIAATGSIVDSYIIAPGNPDSKTPAIQKIFVGDSVINSQFLAGYSALGVVANGNGSIGKVTVRKDWTGSSLVAGVDAGVDNLFGTIDDVAVAGGADGLVSTIASVIIKGAIEGTVGAGDHFGFVAEHIEKFKADGNSVDLTDGPGTDLAGFEVGANGDTTVREVSAPA